MDSKNIANKINDTLAELSLPQIYDYTFFRIETEEGTENYTCLPYQQKKYNKPYSKEELTRAIQPTKNFAPGPDKIHNEILKHLPPERLHSLLVLYNNVWQKEYFPEKWFESTIMSI